MDKKSNVVEHAEPVAAGKRDDRFCADTVAL